MDGWKGPLVVLDYPGGKGGGMNAKQYCEQVLEGCLLEFYKEMRKKRQGVIFQQDNAPSHTAKTTLTWLRNHAIPVLFHPPNSPDLTPIEPVWQVLKHALRALQPPPSTLEGLKQVIRDAWEALSIDDIEKHTRTMDDRVHAIQLSKGGHTHF